MWAYVAILDGNKKSGFIRNLQRTRYKTKGNFTSKAVFLENSFMSDFLDEAKLF